MNSLQGQYEIVQELTENGLRACTYKIRLFDGGVAVLKTYYPEYSSYCDREVEAIQELSKIDKYNVIPTLLETGKNFFVIPYYDDVLSKKKKPSLRKYNFNIIPLHIASIVFKSLEIFYENGYEILEVHPCHIIFDKERGIKIIDFEYAFPRMAKKGIPFTESRTIHGANKIADWPEVMPIGTAGGSDFYKKRWFQATGLPLNSILNDPIWLQHCKRSIIVTFLVQRRLFHGILHRFRKICLRRLGNFSN